MIEFALKIREDIEYDAAWLHCLTLNHNGHKDWRLPTQTEYEKRIITISWYENRISYDLLWFCQPVRNKDD